MPTTKKTVKADVSAVFRKMKAGETLTPAEVLVLSTERDKRKTNPVTQADVARFWGVSRQMVQSWVGMGMPLDNLPVAEAWRNERAKATGYEIGSAGKAITGKDAKERLAIAQARLAEIKVDKELGQMIDRKEVDSLFSRVALSQKQMLFARLERELPAKITGLGVTEIREQCKAVADEICDIMQSNIDEWTRGQ